jgi:molybdopterin synthase catalytic subunit
MVLVKLFAALRDAGGEGEIKLALPSPISVRELLIVVGESAPALRDLLAARRLLVSVNQEFAGEETLVRDGDEVALLPPFSGGAEEDLVRIQAEEFSVEAEVARVRKASTRIGGIVTFLGTARDFSRGRAIQSVTFEHYPGMAEKKLREIRERALRDFGVLEVAIIHRTGSIAVGEEIVLIVVGAEHREEAFQACQWCIDELKRTAPIWKRETTAEGEVWVEEHP